MTVGLRWYFKHTQTLKHTLKHTTHSIFLRIIIDYYWLIILQFWCSYKIFLVLKKYEVKKLIREKGFPSFPSAYLCDCWEILWVIFQKVGGLFGLGHISMSFYTYLTEILTPSHWPIILYKSRQRWWNKFHKHGGPWFSYSRWARRFEDICQHKKQIHWDYISCRELAICKHNQMNASRNLQSWT